MLIFRRIQLCTSSIWYCHSLWEFFVACRCTAWVRTDCGGTLLVGVLRPCVSYFLVITIFGKFLSAPKRFLCSIRNVLRHPPTTSPPQSVLTQAVYRQATMNSHRELQYHMLDVHNCILLKMSTWGSKHVEENIILWINNNQCIKLVINIQLT